MFHVPLVMYYLWVKYFLWLLAENANNIYLKRIENVTSLTYILANILKIIIFLFRHWNEKNPHESYNLIIFLFCSSIYIWKIVYLKTAGHTYLASYNTNLSITQIEFGTHPAPKITFSGHLQSVDSILACIGMLHSVSEIKKSLDIRFNLKICY